MTQSTETLDARIREVARRKHENTVDRAMDPLRVLLFSQGPHHGSDNTGIKSPDGWFTDNVTGTKFLRVDQMWRAIRDSVFKLTAPDAEEAAVAAFVTKVDTLQEQLDELRGEIPA